MDKTKGTGESLCLLHSVILSKKIYIAKALKIQGFLFYKIGNGETFPIFLL